MLTKKPFESFGYGRSKKGLTKFNFGEVPVKGIICSDNKDFIKET
jgi:hypothetical protein